MAVKVFIKRHIKEGKTKEVFALLKKHRIGAMNQKGYVTGETLMSYNNLSAVYSWSPRGRA